jgi:hypothetical protein
MISSTCTVPLRSLNAPQLPVDTVKVDEPDLTSAAHLLVGCHSLGCIDLAEVEIGFKPNPSWLHPMFPQLIGKGSRPSAHPIRIPVKNGEGIVH